MNPLNLPWLEFCFAATLVGVPFVSRLRDPERAYRWGVAFLVASFSCAFLARSEIGRPGFFRERFPIPGSGGHITCR